LKPQGRISASRFLSNYVALPEVHRGSLAVPLPEFPVPDFWIKAMVPIDRLTMPLVGALLRFIHDKEGGSDSFKDLENLSITPPRSSCLGRSA
jgi:hypothetical protein